MPLSITDKFVIDHKEKVSLINHTPVTGCIPYSSELAWRGRVVRSHARGQAFKPRLNYTFLTTKFSW